MLDNVVMSRLYRPGSVWASSIAAAPPEVAYVSKSGGMSNELARTHFRYAHSSHLK